MACILIEHIITKERFWQPENTPYTDQYVVVAGIIDWNCGPQPSPGLGGDRTIEEEFSKEGIQWGDAISWVTSRLGIKECGGCAARREILNHARQNGWKATLKAIKGTFNDE